MAMTRAGSTAILTPSQIESLVVLPLIAGIGCGASKSGCPHQFVLCQVPTCGHRRHGGLDFGEHRDR